MAERVDNGWERFLPAANGNEAKSEELAALARSARILITGAGGSIGAALTKAVAATSPASLTLLDASEQNLFELGQMLRAAPSDPEHRAVLGSVSDTRLLDDVFARDRPHLIFHAAAFKHVSVLERNPFAAIENNTLATQALIAAAKRHQSARLVLVSTDKAVYPRSIMGASKRIAELLAANAGTATCQITSLRLVNVIGSSGSVVPIFHRQAAARQPLTVTDAATTRFFISSSQAVAAMLACANSPYGGAIHVVDAGPAIKIVQLADYLRGQNAILFTGLQPGEKLHEDLLYAREVRLGSVRSSLTAYSTPVPDDLLARLRILREAVEQRDLSETLHQVQALVPEYVPSDVLLAGTCVPMVAR